MGALQKREEEGKEAVTLMQDTEEEKEMLRDYFQLNVKLEDLYKELGDTDPHFKRIANIFTGQFVCVCTGKISLIIQSLITEPIFAKYTFVFLCLTPGVRMLRQDPTECLFSFICTSNNHISRIQSMVEKLCQALGTPLCQLDQTSYYNFPSLSALAGGQKCSLDPYSYDSHIPRMVVTVVQD